MGLTNRLCQVLNLGSEALKLSSTLIPTYSFLARILFYTEVITKKNSHRIGGLYVSSPLLSVVPGESRKSPLHVRHC